MASAQPEIGYAPATIEVRPQTLHLGAEIAGVDLTRPLSQRTVDEIRAAFLKWKVVFFRGQHLDHAQHVAFARRFGALTIGHAVFGHVEGFPEIYSVAKNRWDSRYKPAPKLVRPWTGWHADITAAINPPAASMLRGVAIPPYGGDTLWTNLAVAYDGLSATLRGFVDTLRGLHRFEPPKEVRATDDYAGQVKQRPLASEHPLVRVHPETGERVLYVSPSYVKEIVGLAPRESEALLELLWEHVVRPEYTARFKWQPGDIAFWDNRSVCHLAPRDIYESEFDRQLYRVTLVGDVPVGVDGRPSVSISGDPIGAIGS